jgi:N-methylhydantoinase A
VITLSLDKAVEAIETHVAKPLGLSVTDAAAGIIQLVEQNILHAVERASLEKGYNPRAFTLVAAGGAGPLHGPSTARLLGSPSLYIPRLAGVFCAFGMCNSDLRHDFVRSWLRDLDQLASGPDKLEGAFEAIEADAREVLAREGFTGSKALLKRAFDLRYFGQQWTIAVECSSTDAATIRAAFEQAYQRLFGYVQPAGAIEVVNLRLAAIGKLDALEVANASALVADPVPHSRRPVWIDKKVGFVDTPVYDGTVLKSRQQLAGPAIIEEATTTLILGMGDKLTMTGAGNYHVDIAHGEAA